MAADQIEVFCVIDGEYSLFSIKIQSRESVSTLKDKIKETAADRFANIGARNLELYQVEIPKFDEMPEDDIKQAVLNVLPKLPPKLNAKRKLVNVFEGGPTDDTLVIVKAPLTDEELKRERLKDPKFVKYVDAIRILTKTLGTYTVEDLAHESNHTHLHIGVDLGSPSPFLHPNSPNPSSSYEPPLFVSEYLKTLDAKRWASQAQLQTLKEIYSETLETDFTPHFDASEDKAMSSMELRTYTAHLESHGYYLDTVRDSSSGFKDAHVTVYLVDPALTHNKRNTKSWKYTKNISWDFLLLRGTFADRDSLYTFQPRSDFCLSYPIYGPLILGEVISEDGESDRWRMLLEGVAVCRYQNKNCRTNSEAVVLCLYLNGDYKMEEYLVYQAERDTQDVHILHNLTLELPKPQDAFRLSKRLFNFRDHLAGIPEIPEESEKHISDMKLRIKELFKVSLSSAKRMGTTGQGRRSSQAPSGLGPITEDLVLQASFKAIHILHHAQKNVATAIRRSDMQSVVLKRIRANSSELRILRLLRSCPSQDLNHIIPLLEVVERLPEISTLVMPYYTPILELSQGRAEELALQLIRGVDWLHRQLVSHCDIKERNLVFDEKQNRLYIIDFGLAVKLTSREQKVQGARGTVEHVAPEVGIKSSWNNDTEEVFLDEDSIYSPILADVWAVGNAIHYFHWKFGSSAKSIGTVVETVAKELRLDDPTKRLSLNDAERRIVEACTTVATVQLPPAATPWTHTTHSSIATVVTLQA